jgi:hypothetical protein
VSQTGYWHFVVHLIISGIFENEEIVGGRKSGAINAAAGAVIISLK